jgi:probable phosphoglycerate mutase
MAMKKRMIYLIRHAEPLRESREKIFLGYSNPPLSPHGIRQARSLARVLQGRQIEAVYCSDLQRSKQTAEIIAAGLQVDVKSQVGLREISLGEWEGFTFGDVRQKYPAEYEKRGKDIVNYRPPGGESFADLAGRVLPAFAKIAEETAGNIVIVGHAGVNRVILCHLQQIDLRHLLSIKQEYGQVTVIQQSGNIFRVGGVNLDNIGRQEGDILH